MSAEEIEQEQQSTEETAEVEEETTEAEETEVSEESTEETEPAEDLEQIRKDAKAFKDQKIRAEKAEAELKKLKGKGATESRAPNKDGNALSEEQEARLTKAEDRAERAELRGIGVTHADDIQLVRDAAKRLGVDSVEAANDEFVKNKLERQRAKRKTRDNTPAPTKGNGQAPKKGKDAWDMSDEEFQKERARIMSGK